MTHHAKHDDRYPPRDVVGWPWALMALSAFALLGVAVFTGSRARIETIESGRRTGAMLTRIEAELAEQKTEIFACRMAIEAVAKRLGETRVAITGVTIDVERLDKRTDRLFDQLQGARVDVMNRLDVQVSRLRDSIDKAAMETIVPVVLKLADEANAKFSVFRVQLSAVRKALAPLSGLPAFEDLVEGGLERLLAPPRCRPCCTCPGRCR